MGMQAAHLILRSLDNGSVSVVEERLKPELVLRASTGPAGPGG
jgi:LacI family transcriptional regulator